LCPRTLTRLKKNGIATIEDLLEYTPDQLLVLRAFGKTSLNEVTSKLKSIGLFLNKPRTPERMEAHRLLELCSALVEVGFTREEAITLASGRSPRI